MERHSLVLIIALGESLLSVGAGAGPAVTEPSVIATALVGFVTTVCLWRLYFKDAAPAAGRALDEAPDQSRLRQRLAADAYSLAHFPLMAGVIYFSLGVAQVLARVSSGNASTLDWTSAMALYGGVALYLLGRFAFLRLAVRTTSPGQVAAIGLLVLLIPAARLLPAAAALGLVAAVLVVLVGYEQLAPRERQ